VAAVLCLIALVVLSRWAAEYLWFRALGYEPVFWMYRALKLGLLVLGFATVLAWLGVNLRFAVRHLREAPGASALIWFAPQSSTRRVPGNLTAGAVLVALVLGFIMQSQWDALLRLLWAQSYGLSDPIYGRDIGFYLFALPFLERLQNTLLTLSLLTTGVVLWAYFDAGLLRFDRSHGLEGSPPVRWHALLNVALFLALFAWGFYLDRYALLQSSDGAVYGAGYTDTHIARPALSGLALATLALALLVLVPRFARHGRPMILALGGYVVLNVVGAGIAPWLVQSFRVEPDELELETPYLRYNIAFTRAAFGIDAVDERSDVELHALGAAALERNGETVDNIRLWDWLPLRNTYRQLQRIRAYYEFSDVDVDRYAFGGAYRQVMLAARELSDALPGGNDTWVNRRLQYTHGYGAAMSLSAEKSAQGNPILLVKDLPPETVAGIALDEPAIYYGEQMSGYRIVNTAIAEFDYPKGDNNVYTRYRGHGGVRLDSFWKRLLYAWEEGDTSIAIASYITPRSRIQYWRTVAERVGRLAPFLHLDEDPYPVISNGKLYWVLDAYTLASRFPYAEPYRGDFNYIRNSVKVVVDAFQGDVSLYVMDPADAVLRVYTEALPSLFAPLERMPEDLRRHLRYPQALFQAQVEKYSTYHMTAPQVFYNREDLWAAPREKYAGEVVSMRPYYVLMRLPGESTLQFLLMTPLTPAGRDNMIAWVAARCDFPGYGELVVYKLSKEHLIVGPIQVEALIDQDTGISQKLSLWDQRGSRGLRGNLLVIPMDHSFVYVEPVYLIAEDTDIPQLKRIIVSDGRRLAMAPTLGAALERVYNLDVPGPSAVAPAAPSPSRLARARDKLAAAEDALREGQWEAFGQALQELKRLLGK